MGHSLKARLAEPQNSTTAVPSARGTPWPPNSAGAPSAGQPPATNCWYASRNPGAVTTPSGVQRAPAVSPGRFSGSSTSSAKRAASSSTDCASSSE